MFGVMLKKVVATLIFALFGVVSYAQQAQSALVFSAESVNLGTISEDGGVVTAYVEARNGGAIPIYILKIETSCGCTSVDYPREAIQPNQSVRVGVSFDPMNRPGRFERDVAVVVSDCDAPVILGVRGYVEPRERTVDELYPFDMGGGLRLSTTSRAFGYLEQGWHSEESIEYVNTSQSAVSVVLESVHSSELLTVDMPRSIAPGERGSILLRYALPEDGEVYGTRSDEFYLVVDGVRARYRLTTEVIAVDNFNAQGDISAPIADISKNIIKFGEVNCPNSIYRERLRLENNGGSALVVRCVESTSEAVTCSLSHDGEIASGDGVWLDIALDSSKIANADELFVARIRLITNDPLRPMQTIKITAIPMW